MRKGHAFHLERLTLALGDPAVMTLQRRSYLQYQPEIKEEGPPRCDKPLRRAAVGPAHVKLRDGFVQVAILRVDSP